MHTVLLDQHADFAAWQVQARDFCAAGVPPEGLRFVPPDAAGEALPFAQAGLPEGRRRVTASKAFMERAPRVACVSDPTRYDRLYRLLWRL